jgi:hypothetical protein
MGLFDALSGKEARNTAIFNAGQADIGLQAQQVALQQGQAGALGSLENGYARAAPQYDAAQAMFDPYAAGGGAAFTTQQNALGLGGPEGYNQAVATFQESPGYKYAVDQALDGVRRGASVTGFGGNEWAALADRAGNMANQEFGNWYNRLNGIADRGYNATSSQASIEKGEGDLGYRLGSDQAGVYTGTSSNLSNAISDRTKAITGAANSALAGDQKADNNVFNGVLSVANLGSKLFGLL